METGGQWWKSGRSHISREQLWERLKNGWGSFLPFEVRLSLRSKTLKDPHLELITYLSADFGGQTCPPRGSSLLGLYMA